MESGINDLASSAKGELEGMKHMAHDAFQSKAYLYPLKGIFYFINHPDLWRPMWLRLGPSFTTAFIVTLLMFFFTYFPQVFVFGVFNGPLALVNVFFLVLSESAAISAAISKSMFLEQGLIDTFDATLIEKGSADIVARGRELKPGGNVWQKMGKKAKAPFSKFAPGNVIRYLMLLPLNFIPVVGTIIFLYLQGKKYGPVSHNRYFQLKGMSQKSIDMMIEQNRGAYTAFGVPAAMLEHLTAFTGIFFAYTNTVGAALWAHDMEKHFAADQALHGLRDMTNQKKGQILGQFQLSNSPNFENHQGESFATRFIGDRQAQIDALVVEQVAQNLKAQTDALAEGVSKIYAH